MIIKNLIYCALITLIAFCTPALADYNIAGDVNNDGIITTADSLLALQMSVGSIVLDPEIADVNADGKVNSPDALMMLMMAQKAQVRVDAPEVVSGTFNAMIDIYNVADLDSGQFDLSFDARVVNVIGVNSGSIDGTEVPIDMWELIDSDTIRVIFNLPDITGVSGSGSLATISFEVLGVTDDTSVLAISDGLLVDIETNEISSLWFDDVITAGILVTINAPEPVSGTFDATIDIAEVTNLDSGQFDLSFDASVVNVTGVNSGSIDGTEVPVDMWRFMDTDTIRVIFNLPNTTGISGSGSLAMISFEVLGVAEDTSVLAISDGLLVDIETNEISSFWIDDGITVEVPVQVPVTVNAPEIVSGTFDATIDIADVTNLDSGEFDLSFDVTVVNVTGVNSGSIDGTEVPIDMWRFMDTDTIRVIFNLPNTTGISGSGSLAAISFEVLGVAEDTSVLAISDGLLVDNESNEISSLWIDDGITVEVPVQVPVTVNAPEVVTGTFDATIDIADVINLDSGEFDLSFDATVVNVTGVNSGSIDGTEVPIDMWRFMDTDTIRVIFNLPNTTGISGSGSLAAISFEVLGVAEDTSVLAISDGLLVDNESNEISSLWIDDGITVEVPVQVPVTVNAPESVSGTFDATIDIADVINLDSGEFDLSFDATVVNVTGVNSGSIDGTEVPIDMWRFMDTDTIRVIFNLPNTTGISGSGSLAAISFEVLGVAEDTSVLAISDGLLVDNESNEISSLWIDDGITVEVPVQVPVTVNAPESVSGTFDATIDIADVINLDSGEFDLSFDATVVNVTGVNSGSIDGTEVPIDMWRFIDPDTIRVIFNLPNTTGISGSGSLAAISFEVLGVADDTSVLAISDGLLVDNESNEISSLWFDDGITVDEPVDVIVGVPVTVNAPEVVTGTFDATIDIADVINLDSGEFDLSFDASVVNVTGVNSGSIDGTEVPVDMWRFIDPDTIRVIFNLPGTTGVSGSGLLATISFDVLGVTDDTSVLAISDGLLVDTESNEISSLWFDDGITVDEPVDVIVGVPVTVNAPEVVTGTFDATIDIADVTNLDSGEFDLSFDASVVNVTGVNSGSIDGTEVPVDMWRFIDPDTIRVIFNLPGTTGVSGSGSLAAISFEVLGVTDDTSVLAISDGLLVDTESNEISSLWFDDEITVDEPVDVIVGVPVTVNAPESVSGTFDATIDIADVSNLDSGQFDLSFDVNVVNVTGVDSGSIGSTTVQLESWTLVDSDTVRVLFNLPGTTGVSGSGSLATIHFTVTGTVGDTSVLDISDGLLVDIQAEEILSTWIDDEVTV